MHLCRYLITWFVIIVITIFLPIQFQYKMILLLIYTVILHRLLRILYYACTHVPRILAGNKYSYLPMVSNIFSNCFTLRHNFKTIPLHPTIFLSTYPTTVLEYTIPRLIPTRLCFLTSRRAENVLKLVYDPEEYLVFNDSKSNNYEYLREKIRKRIQTISMFVYVEDKTQRLHDFHVGNMRKGMFYIAKELGITITPLAVDIMVIENGVIPEQKFEVLLGPTQKVTDPVTSMREVRKFLSHSKRHFQKTKFTSSKVK